MKPALVRVWSLAAGIGCGLGGLRAQAPVVAEQVIELPPLIIEEKLPPLNWRYATLDGREVLSVCDDAATEKFMHRDWRLEQWLQQLLPARFRVRLPVPEGQILFTEATGRLNAREIIAEMAGREGARLAADGTVVATAARPAGFGGRGRRVEILPNMRLDDRDVVRVFAVLTPDTRQDFVFARERVAFLLKRRMPALPPWFIEGFVQLYEQTRFHEDEFEFAPMAWTSPALTDALARDPEQPRVLLPMDEFFSRPAGGKKDDGEEAGIRRAQAALWVRWALAEGEELRREQFWRWLDRLDEAPASEPAFRACFGFGYADARDRLSDYLREAVGQRARRPARKIGRPPRVALRAATELEIARLRGDWERLQAQYVRARHPELAGRYFAQARRTLLRAYERGERDPRLLASMGLLECDEGKAAAGRAALEAAARQNPLRPRLGFELARLRAREFENGDRAHRFTESETQAILEPLRRAVQEAPPLPEIYLAIAETWLRSAVRPEAGDLVALEQGVRDFPEATGFVFAAVQLHLNAGAVAKAQALAERGRWFAPDPNVHPQLEQICRELAEFGDALSGKDSVDRKLEELRAPADSP